MISKGAVVDKVSDLGYTPFYVATFTSQVSVARYLLDKGANIYTQMPPDESSKGPALEWASKHGTPEMKKLFRKYISMRVRRCVLGPVSEHSWRQKARDLAPTIASFLV